MFEKFTRVKIDERSWRFAERSERTNFLQIYLLTGSDVFFINNLNEHKIGRILQKDFNGINPELRFILSQMRHKYS
jgi:hypothetical protein